ncbi:MAG TPA: M48 family metalloprotease [Bdellovibrionota bacterium]|nr:M48 family metalloprotease [Bdellovibrionota bacterium]
MALPSSSTPEFHWATHPQAAYAAIVAIPLVIFALWGEYASRDFEVRRKAKPGEWEPDAEVGKVRLMAMLGLLVQGMVYVISFGLPDVSRLVPFTLFLVSLAVQNGIVNRLETAIRGPKAPPADASPESKDSPAAGDRPTEGQLAGLGIRVMGWMLTSVLLYLAVIHACVRLALAGTKVWHLTELAANALVLSGMAMGIFGGLALSFALAPFYLRRILPVKALEPGELRDRVQRCFADSTVPVPDFWVVDTRLATWNQVLYSGFPGGRGPFRPGVFLSISLAQRLGDAELRTALLREVAHIRLKHFRNRLWFGFVMGALSIVVAGGLLLLSQTPGVEEALAAGMRLLAVAVPLALPYLSVRFIIRRQDESADLHAVVDLGADLESMVSLLVKLEILAGRLAGPGERLRGSPDPVATAGALARRISHLKRALERRGYIHPVSKDDDQDGTGTSGSSAA